MKFGGIVLNSAKLKSQARCHFDCRQPSILLLDDVITTGETMAHVASYLGEDVKFCAMHAHTSRAKISENIVLDRGRCGYI